MDQKSLKLKIKTLSAILTLLTLTSCTNPGTSTPGPLPYEIKEQINRDFIIIRDPELESYLNGLVFRLVASYSNQVSIEITKDQRLFAKSFPGGLVLVSTGLLQICASESELAFVLAHELGHIILGHHSLAVKGIELSELKERELAADSFGVKALIRAGYSLGGAFSSIQRITEVWDFYGSHSESGYPTAVERLASIQSQMLGQACLSTGSCLMGGISNTRDYVKFKMRLQTLQR